MIGANFARASSTSVWVIFIVSINNPTGLLGTTPFRSLDLEGRGPFKEQYLNLVTNLAADGCRAALDAIMV